jgi:hypothetical protein
MFLNSVRTSLVLCSFLLSTSAFSGTSATLYPQDNQPLHLYTATAPVSIVVPLQVQPSEVDWSRTVYVGIHSSATRCIDRNLGEQEYPPPPPVGVFEVRLIDPRRVDSCMGQGLKIDLRHYAGVQTDTFLLKFQGGDPGGYPLTFSWPDLNTYFSGSVVLQDLFGGIIVNVDMKTQNSYTLNLQAIDRLYVIASNPNYINNGPIVLTVGSSSYTNSATVWGSVVPNGMTTTFWFEWGETDALENMTDILFVGDSLNVLYRSLEILGLHPRTTYYFRAAANNAAGTVYGETFILTTTDSIIGGHIAVPLFIQNNGGDSTVLTFGFDPIATHCLDSALGEYEIAPPGPPEIFDVRFTDPRGFDPECLGQGTYIDYRPFPFGAGVDTFLVRIQAGNGGYPVVLWWPNNLGTYFNNLHLVDMFNGVFYNVDMLTTTNVVISNSAIDRLYIFANPKTIVGGPPRVITEFAEVLNQHSARIYGSVSTNGAVTTAWFEWGTTTFYGNTTPFQYFDSPYITTLYSDVLFGLEPNRTYHFRAVAQNNYGTSWGNDMTFTTSDNGGGIRIPLFLTDFVSNDSLVFGVDPLATFCLDSALGEFPLPPVPPTGVFEARFVNPRGYDNGCFDLGTKLDFRPLVRCFPERCRQVDTFLVRFQKSIEASDSFYIRWPDLHSFYGGPVFLIYGDLTIDMMQQNFAYLFANAPDNFTIIAYDPFGIAPPPVEAHPFIYSVEDVPFDQGGRVSVRWNASSLDVNEHIVQYYSIWRATPESVMVSSPLVTLQDVPADFKGTGHRLMPMNGYEYAWEFVGIQPAHQFNRYAYTAPTLYDSMAGTDGKHYFLVSAHTYIPEEFYDSNVDSGYSVDNLRPRPPRNLRIEGDFLMWDASPDDDVALYLVFFSETPNFDIESATLRGQTTDTSVLLGGPQRLGYFAICAQDVHGNISEKSNEVYNGNVGVKPQQGEIPEVFGLSQNYPNPFNPSTTFNFDLPQEGFVQLKIFNPLGQEVRTLANSHYTAGRYSVNFDGTGLQSGVYFYQITVVGQDGILSFRDVKKFLLLK